MFDFNSDSDINEYILSIRIHLNKNLENKNYFIKDNHKEDFFYDCLKITCEQNIILNNRIELTVGQFEFIKTYLEENDEFNEDNSYVDIRQCSIYGGE